MTDIIYGGAGNDNLRGNGGQDTIHGEEGNDTLIGGQGNDELFGGADDDFLDGRAGNDLLSGGAGEDRLRGAAGSDIFVFETDHEQVTILDFQDDEDQLDLSSYGFLNIDQAIANMEQVELNVIFMAGDDELTINNITISQLQDDILI